MSTVSAEATGGGAQGNRTSASGSRGGLVTERGRTTVADAVVQKIAGIAAREVSGVYDLGTGGPRAIGAVRERIPGSRGPSVTQGVAVEVGETQAAVDVDIVCEYGVSIADLAAGIRRNITQAIEGMTGLEVVEVNIAVDDIHLPDSGDGDSQSSAGSRVQ
ncbi:Asp23/Gls24 family envelope stress response protein [Peterkaempfera griseoplana]|uniref:Asp23/Gls24 family envelope stress response protein n=1 Tax=Peterkaempfera griseoplana TaxID=66896 RepID=UPI0006E2E581|nr:Asp23/Gls24 family envelope stress response protein [Peterkaempfera griseoplana]